MKRSNCLVYSINLCIAALMALSISCAQPHSGTASGDTTSHTASSGTDTATFAAGCFWCVEAQFKQLQGVDTVISGYTGGSVANPTYKQVCSGHTGHAEAVNIIYHPKEISYDALLAAFFVAHDPTQLNR